MMFMRKLLPSGPGPSLQSFHFQSEISADGDNWIECAVLIPDLTRHTETAEIISASFLRESLPCDDGDTVRIRISRTA